jgi:hypothetical protein
VVVLHAVAPKSEWCFMDRVYFISIHVRGNSKVRISDIYHIIFLTKKKIMLNFGMKC